MDDNPKFPSSGEGRVVGAALTRVFQELDLGDIVNEAALRENFKRIAREIVEQSLKDFQFDRKHSQVGLEHVEKIDLARSVVDAIREYAPDIMRVHSSNPLAGQAVRLQQFMQETEELNLSPDSGKKFRYTSDYDVAINTFRAKRALGKEYDDADRGRIAELQDRERQKLEQLSAQYQQNPSDEATLGRMNEAQRRLSTLGVLDKQANPTERELDPLLGIRAAAMRARTRISNQGRGSLDEAQVAEYTELAEKLRKDAMEFVEKADALEMGGGDRLEVHQLSSQAASRSKLATEIENVLRSNAEEQNKTMTDGIGMLAKVATTLGIGAVANRVLFSDPMRYGFMPAMNVMSGTGEVGQSLSKAMTSSEEYDVARRQEVFNVGMGASLSALTMKGGMRGAMGVLGVLTMVGGGTGIIPDIMSKMGLNQSDEELRSISIAQDLANPQRLTTFYQQSAPGLMDLGYRPDQGIGSNNVVSQMYDPRLDRLGVSQEDAGAFMTQATTQVDFNRGSSINEVMDTAYMGRMFGLSESEMLSMMASAQRTGSDDVVRSLRTLTGATADEDGNISNYNRNVLVPALMQVTESLSLQNVARSSESLEKEVAGLYRVMSAGDSVFAERVRSSPALMASISGGLSDDVKGIADDPAWTQFALSRGASLYDILQGDLSVLDSTVLPMVPKGVTADDLIDEDFVNQNQGVITMLQAAGGERLQRASGGVVMTMLNIISQAMRAGTFAGIDTSDFAQIAEDDDYNRFMGLDTEALADLQASVTGQTDLMMEQTGNLIDDMVLMQRNISSAISAANLEQLARDGIDSIVKELREALGLDGAAQGGTGASGPDLSPEQVEDYFAAPSLDPSAKAMMDFYEAQSFGSEEEAAAMRQTIDARRVRQGESPLFGYATGGPTGRGGRTDVAGYVHGGEYVINDNYANIPENRSILDRMNAGEDVRIPRSSESAVSSDGARTRLVMDITGVTADEIDRRAWNAAAKYANDNKLHYN